MHWHRTKIDMPSIGRQRSRDSDAEIERGRYTPNEMKQMPSQLPRRSFCLMSLAVLVALGWLACPLAAKNYDAGGGPSAVYVIRHAEKPDSADDPNLSSKGYERAKALAGVIPQHFCTPDFIFATAPSKHSVRPLETVRPLAEVLKMKILDPYADADYAKLAHDLLTDPRYSGKTILVCWHHGAIPNLAKALGAKDAPDKWNPDVFDRVWLLKFADGKVQFLNLPQKAMPGDSEN
jgi:phosphohistidine phosphatase SixA